MSERSILLFLSLLISLTLSAQQSGYWDKERATTKEVAVGAGKRIVVNTEEFPIGTTEVVYRITLLDENQQMANSLVSLLKSIPDPTGISQGSAGGVFLLSKISGDDKCKYAIFNSEAKSRPYKENGKVESACIIQQTPVNKDARRISLGKSSCLGTNTRSLWFGLESTNWVFKQRIVLEVVPWVDNSESRGWTDENKAAIITLAKSSDLVRRMLDPDDFCLCILSRFQKRYRFDEYNKLLAIEKTKAFRDFGNECLANKPENKAIRQAIRKDVSVYISRRQYEDAIGLMLTGIFEHGGVTALDYNQLGYAYMCSRQYSRAIKAFRDGEKLDSSELLLQMNLAHTYVLNDEFSKAKDIHKKYRGQNVTASQSWENKALSDIENLKAAGINHADFKRIKDLLE